MKLVIALVTAAFLQAGASGYAQQLTIKVKNAPIVNILGQIKQQTGYDFLYNNTHLEGTKPVSLNFTNASLSAVLDACFAGQPLTYQIDNKTVLVYRRSNNQPAGPGTGAIQKREITGQVVDEEGVPLEWVTVAVKGAGIATTTDVRGSYELEVPEGNLTLVFSLLGYGEQEIPLGTANVINVTLKIAISNLDEVVVVGYGTMKKRDLTGAVSQINASTTENENPGNVQDILRGNITGLNVGFNASAKSGGSLEVRGRKSLTAGGSPLIVLDGVIFHGSLEDINPNDIETIDVLKDASSAAVYGAKSANGVIIVNTKKGQAGKPQINFNTTFSMAEMSVQQPIYDPEGYLRWREDVFKSTNANHRPYQYSDPRTLPADISVEEWLAYDASSGDPVEVWLQRLNLKQVEIENYKTGKSINWYDKVFQRGFQQDYNLSLSNRKEDVSYYLSVGYRNNQGIIVGDKFSTVRARLNIESQVTDFIEIGVNSQFGGRDESQVPAAWQSMVNVSPWGNYYGEDGMLRLSPQDDPAVAQHPFLNPEYIDRLRNYTSFNASLYTKITLPWKITYQFNYTPYVEWYKYFNHQSSKHPMWGLQGGLASRMQSQIYSWQIDNLIKWNKTFNGQHSVDLTFLVNAEKFQSWENNIDGKEFNPSDQLGYHNIGAGVNPIVTSDDQYSTGDALMARIFYAFKDRYLLTLSLRRDGYSAFGQRNPRATFPAAALGWVVSEEPFFKSKWLSYAKLRLSYGVNGNRDIGRYVALPGLSSGNYMHVNKNGNISNVTSLEMSRMSNLDLKWEKTTSLNAGLDFSLLEGKLDGSFELYDMNTTDLLVERTLPSIVGYNSVIANLGEVNNKGFEFHLTSRIIKREKFSWRSTINFSLNRNKIVSLYGDMEDITDSEGNVIGSSESNDITNQWFIGHDIDAIWDLKALGVYQVDEAETANAYGVSPGDFKLEDVNLDGRYSNEDRQFLGTFTPRYRWSFRNEFMLFKSFDLSFMLYSHWGQKGVFNEAKSLGTGYMDRTNAYILPYWTPDHPSRDFARLSSSSGNATYNIYANKSFIRLDNISLAYQVPAAFISKYRINQARIVLTCNNVGFYSPGEFLWDPENPGPTPRIYSLGVNVTL